MKMEEDKKYKTERMITVTLQFSLFMSKKECEDGTEIPHELVVAGVVEKLAGKEYDVQEDSME